MPQIESAFFREVTLRVCGSLDIDAALSTSLDYIRGWLPISGIALGYTCLPKKRVEIVAQAHQTGASPLCSAQRGGLTLDGAALDYAREADPPSSLLINHPSDAPPALLALLPGLRACSAIVLRLHLSAEEIGALLVWAEGHERFSEADVRLLETIQELMTLAMANARRHRELIARAEALIEDNRALSDDLRRVVGGEIIGADSGLRRVMEQVRVIASSASPALLSGEPGVGKAIIAHTIHTHSPRAPGPMISLDCGALDARLDRELFGEEGIRGRLERADGGTLLLDEIGALSLETQAKLLRALQERRFEQVGGGEPLEVDVRVIATTHRDLERMTRDGAFLEALWDHLSVLPIHIPPLRQRREDIPSLAQHFIARGAQRRGWSPPRASRRDLRRLVAYDWPGNVRELQGVVERALLRSRGGPLVFPALGAHAVVEPRAAPGAGPLPTIDAAMAAHIRAALARTRWKISGPGGAAELLGINPSTLRSRMRKLGISWRIR